MLWNFRMGSDPMQDHRWWPLSTLIHSEHVHVDSTNLTRDEQLAGEGSLTHHFVNLLFSSRFLNGNCNSIICQRQSMLSRDRPYRFINLTIEEIHY